MKKTEITGQVIEAKSEPIKKSKNVDLTTLSDEQLQKELSDRSTARRRVVLVATVAISYYKERYCNASGNITLSDCIKKFETCDDDVLQELSRLYNRIKVNEEDAIYRRGYADACNRYTKRNYGR